MGDGCEFKKSTSSKGDSTHTTFYSSNLNIRISGDVHPDGSVTGIHITDQDRKKGDKNRHPDATKNGAEDFF